VNQLDQLRAQLGIERLDQVADVGLVQIADQRAQQPGIAPVDRLGYLRDVVGPDGALFVAQRHAGALGRVGQILLVEHVFFVEHAGSAQHLMDDSIGSTPWLGPRQMNSMQIPVVSSQLRRKLRPEGLIAEADWLGFRRSRWRFWSTRTTS
jgi:hypothetical protein